MAFTTGSLDHVMDTLEITKDWPTGLTGEAKTQASNAYQADGKARSILSIPVPGNNELIGVVNIYRDSPGIMGSEDRAVNFERIMSPFVRELGVILVNIKIDGISVGN